jgi:aldehyde:ferredoxin oxidoreductase
LREGIDLSTFQIPDRVIGHPAQSEGPLTGVSVDKNTLVKEYLEQMDWDPATGKPSLKKLQELGLNDVARNLYP